MKTTIPHWKPFIVRRIHMRIAAGMVKSDWDCGEYSALLTVRADGNPLQCVADDTPVAGEPEAVIQICSVDGSARHDWRDFQHIKNSIIDRDARGDGRWTIVYPPDYADWQVGEAVAAARAARFEHGQNG